MSTKELRVLKKDSCPSLSGKSKLSYVIACDDKDELLISITGNTGGGFWAKEWVAVKDIEAALAKTPEAITSLAVSKLFKGRSVNSAGFLLAALKHLGVVQAVKGRQRKHTFVDMGRITNLSTAPTTKKTPVRKKAAPSRAKKQ